MLLNDFFTYKVIEQTEESIVAEVTVNSQHDIYNGHFPEMPITPGVCQVQMIQEILNETKDLNYRLRTARDIKFLNFIDPTKISTLVFELSLKPQEDNALAVNALITNEGLKYLKMRSVFIAE